MHLNSNTETTLTSPKIILGYDSIIPAFYTSLQTEHVFLL